ncbi:hypothetical protein PM082_010993 [Marasmius tenuissimus]|nr:hypothetical protein PM082_010993 [Marasmius tenuissimus]
MYDIIDYLESFTDTNHTLQAGYEFPETAEEQFGGFKVLDKPDFHDTWAALEKIHQSGKAKASRVFNSSAKILVALAQTQKVVPAVNQVELVLFPDLSHTTTCAPDSVLRYEAWRSRYGMSAVLGGLKLLVTCPRRSSIFLTIPFQTGPLVDYRPSGGGGRCKQALPSNRIPLDPLPQFRDLTAENDLESSHNAISNTGVWEVNRSEEMNG